MLIIFVLAVVFFIIAYIFQEWIEKHTENTTQGFLGQILAIVYLIEWLCFGLGLLLLNYIKK